MARPAADHLPGACAITATERQHGRRGRRPSRLAVRLRGITKRFPGVVANHDIDLDVRAGTVHAIVGENGAGKSTLMKILYGMQKPDEGTIDGRRRAGHASARRPTPSTLGIGMVLQHFMLADNLTVLENVVLGAEKLHGIGDQARAEIEEISDALRLRTSTPTSWSRTSASATGSGWRSSRCSTAAPRSSSSTSRPRCSCRRRSTSSSTTCASSRREGLTVIFISHKLDEVLAVADDITVIRRGTTVGDGRARPTSPPAQLAELMVGCELPSPETAESTVTDDGACSTVDGRHASRDAGRPRAARATSRFDDPPRRGARHRRRRGQRPGRAGRGDHGHAARRPPARSSSATRTSPRWSTRRRREAGIGYIPEDRHRHGLLLDAPLWENRILGHQTAAAVGARAPGSTAPARASDTERIVEEYDVRTPGIDVTAARAVRRQPAEAHRRPRDERRPGAARSPPHPTRGVDVGAQAAIWDHIRDGRAARASRCC